LDNKFVEVPSLKLPIQPSPGFQKKELANLKLDAVALCGYGCVYCSSNWGYFLRVHREEFANAAEVQLGRRIYPDQDPSLMIRYPDLLARLDAQLDSHKSAWGEGQTLVFSMLTDGFSPALVRDGTTERVLSLLLKKTRFRIRVLTKNAIVGSLGWLDFFRRNRERFVVGLSIGTLNERWAARMEIGTPSPRERIGALRALQDDGISTFGMLCPVFPHALWSGEVEELLDLIRPDLTELVWAEPYNDRVNWRAVREAIPPGTPEHAWFTDVFEHRDRTAWSRYATELYTRLLAHAEGYGWTSKLRYLLYEGDISPEHAAEFAGLRGLLLQTKQGPDGLSANAAFRALQLLPARPR